MPAAFTPEELRLLRQTRVVQIETRRAPGAPAHRTKIWVVLDDGTPYIRTWRGPQSRWYRELIANPVATLYVGSRQLPVRAVPAPDAAHVAAASSGFEQKYGGDPAVRAMLTPPVLPTTLRLEPA
jgi:hypothetical protein